MAPQKQVDNGAIYELVNSTRLELKNDIVNAVSTVSQNQGRLEKKFDDLEAGRLTRAEANITTLQTREATLNTKVVALVFIVSTLSSAIIYALAARLVK